jgi:hypothetical protein
MQWDIEAKIRADEAAKAFDAEFIELAGAGYLYNEQRVELKRRVFQTRTRASTENL